MIALCDEPTPDWASAASRFGSARAPPTSVPPTVRKSRRLTPSQKPPFLCERPKIVSMKAPLLTDGRPRPRVRGAGDRWWEIVL